MSLFIKCIDVISSCITLKQLQNALNFLMLAKKAGLKHEQYTILIEWFYVKANEIKSGSVVERNTR